MSIQSIPCCTCVLSASYTVLLLSCFFGCICWENYRVLRCDKCFRYRWGTGFPASWGSMIGWSRPLIRQPTINWCGAKNPYNLEDPDQQSVAFSVLGPLQFSFLTTLCCGTGVNIEDLVYRLLFPSHRGGLWDQWLVPSNHGSGICRVMNVLDDDSSFLEKRRTKLPVIPHLLWPDLYKCPLWNPSSLTSLS